MRPNRTSRAGLLVILAGLAVALLLVTPVVASAGLKSQITTTLKRYGMSGNGTSVAVYDLTAKRSVYRLRVDTLRLPASNEKLVTSATALASWTATYRFSTQLFVDAPGADDDGVVHGNVYLRGLGDATFSTKSFAQRHWGMETGDVQDIVRRLGKLGVTRVTGRVIADEGYFDTLRAVPNWRRGMTAYCSPLSALTLNESFASGGGYVSNPALAAAKSLTRRLRAAGIRVGHAPKRGTVPETATLTYTERSARLSLVLKAMNRPSDNFLAEELLKGLGAAFGDGGTTADGAVVAEEFLLSADISGGFRIKDGSGLSYRDRLSARTILKILGTMARRDDAAVFRRSLAVAGVNGTLKYRMRGTAAAGNVRAKTGTLNDASCLSGYVTTANRHALSFSILMNGDPVSATQARAAQDAVAVLLARSKP